MELKKFKTNHTCLASEHEINFLIRYLCLFSSPMLSTCLPNKCLWQMSMWTFDFHFVHLFGTLLNAQGVTVPSLHLWWYLSRVPPSMSQHCKIHYFAPWCTPSFLMAPCALLVNPPYILRASAPSSTTSYTRVFPYQFQGSVLFAWIALFTSSVPLLPRPLLLLLVIYLVQSS
jgi:hypothetical protein